MSSWVHRYACFTPGTLWAIYTYEPSHYSDVTPWTPRWSGPSRWDPVVQFDRFFMLVFRLSLCLLMGPPGRRRLATSCL